MTAITSPISELPYLNNRIALLILICLFTINVHSQSIEEAVDELKEFIAIPNFGLEMDDVQKNIEWLENKFTEQGFQTKQLTTEGNPLLLAELEVDPAYPTLLFYMHLDGQAIDRSKWDQKDPYIAEIKKRVNDEWVMIAEEEMRSLDDEWRIFGRSASDDKGPIVGMLSALKNTPKNKIQHNLKIILDAEEELGSKPLAAAVAKYKDLLKADFLIINDGPVHTSGKPTLVFGCRGIQTVNLTVYGPVKPQHSGHYGNYAPNPIFRLAELLASMKDDDGRVIIDGYYDGIDMTDDIRYILSQVPDDVNKIHNHLQIAIPEKVGNNYQESLQYPSLNARGIASAYVGARARTIVPEVATVAIDMRLVPESDPDHLIEVMKQHIEREGFTIFYDEPNKEERMNNEKLLFFNKTRSATLPFRTAMDSKEGKWLERVLKKTVGDDPVKIRIMGGTVPIAAFINELQIPAIIVPMVNPDNNQHSPNENLRIGNLRYSIEVFEGILTSRFE